MQICSFRFPYIDHGPRSSRLQQLFRDTAAGLGDLDPIAAAPRGPREEPGDRTS